LQKSRKKGAYIESKMIDIILPINENIDEEGTKKSIVFRFDIGCSI
jgi:hypothetical protein